MAAADICQLYKYILIGRTGSTDQRASRLLAGSDSKGQPDLHPKKLLQLYLADTHWRLELMWTKKGFMKIF